MTVRKNRHGRWMIDVKVEHSDGRVERVRKVAPVQTKRDAEAYERDVRRSILDGTRREQSETREVPTFRDFATDYLRDGTTHNKPSTIETKRSIFEHHLLPFFGAMRLDAIGRREIDRFKAASLGNGTHAKTVNNMLTTLRHALDVAAQWELIHAAPRVAWLKAAKPAFRFLDFEEAGRLVAATDGDALGRAMIVVALNTGLRLGELLALKWDAVDLKAGRLHVREAVARGIVGTPKSGRAREVPLNDTAVAALKAHKHLRGSVVFCAEDGRMLTKNEAKAPLRRARARAGIVALGWHDLRHTFASHLVMRGVPLKAVQELLGHATIEMTMRYAHLSPDVTRDAVRALDVQTQGHHRGTLREQKTKTAP